MDNNKNIYPKLLIQESECLSKKQLDLVQNNNFSSVKDELKVIGKQDNHNIELIYQLRVTFLAHQLKGKKKIKVGFINHDISKWKEDSLYSAIKASCLFDSPVIIIIHALGFRYDKDVDKLHESYDFFHKKGYKVEYGYDLDTKKPISPLSIELDIVFFTDINMSGATGHKLEEWSWGILMCYIPYGLHLTNNYHYHYQLKQLSYVWKRYVECKKIHEELIKHSYLAGINSENSGYLKFDLLEIIKKTPSIKKTIIYAPHWSNGDEWYAQYGTFSWSHKIVLKLMIKYPELLFVYKPHPLLKESIMGCWNQKGDVKKDDYILFIDKINKLENVRILENADYMDVFVNSDLMITDSVSFLGEYLPSGNPIILLLNKKSFYNSVGNRIIEGYYKVKDSSELIRSFTDIIFYKIDSLKELRKKILDEIYPDIKLPAASMIINQIKMDLDL